MGDILGGLGGLFGGLAALAAVLVAVWQAGKELDKRRKEREAEREERRREKQAAIAGDLAVAIQRFLIAMNRIASTIRAHSEPKVSGTSPPMAKIRLSDGDLIDEEHPRIVGVEYQQRWDLAAPVFEAFVEAWNLANIYLPPGVSELCAELWTFKADVYSNQQMWIWSSGRQNSDPAFYQGGFGPDVYRRADALKKKTLALLRPLAQLEATTPVNDSAVAPVRFSGEDEGESETDASDKRDPVSEDARANPARPVSKEQRAD